jgi:ComF family protein
MPPLPLAWPRRLLGAALDAALPPFCATCDTPVDVQGTQCAACFGALHFIAGPCCGRCGLPLQRGALLCPACAETPPVYGAARAPLLYDAGARALILPLKYRDRTELARPLAALMARAGRELLREADVLVPVPLHWRRLLKRRYNQAGLLARRLGAIAGKPVLPDALRRARATTPLGGLSALERRGALVDAFRVTPRGAARVTGRRVLLVDDVLTSGATANACAAALLAAGARQVDVLAAARVPDPKADAA